MIHFILNESTNDLTKHIPLFVQQCLQVLDASCFHTQSRVLILQSEALAMLLVQELVGFL
jgi:hypothetical protein